MTATVSHRRPLSERAADIARILGPGWSLAADQITERPDQIQLIGPEGQGIYLSIDQYGRRGRMVISGAYPYDEGYGSYRPHVAIEITVAEARSVGQIAKEIAARFLPAYVQAYARARASQQERADRMACERALMARLAPIVGATATGHSSTEASAYIAGATYVKICTSAGRCKLTIEQVPDEIAEQILHMLMHTPSD